MEKQKNNMGRIISGTKVDFKEYTKGLGEFYFENCDKYADCIYQIDASTDQKESYASIKRRSIRVAVNMKKIGVSSKDIILICSNNTMDNTVPHISTLYLGAKTGSLHPVQSIGDWTHCINMVQPSFIFVEEDCVQNMEISIRDVESRPQIVVFGKSHKYISFDDLQEPSDEETTFLPTTIKDCQETAVILFSSGTTGPPKGMCVSHYSLINKGLVTLGPGPFQPWVGLIYSNLFWISSVLQIVLSFYSGSTKINPSAEFNPREMLEMIDKYKITFAYINPVLLRPVLAIENTGKYDTSSLIFLTTIGTPLSPNENRRLQKIFKNTIITQAYGCSETLGTVIGFNLFRDKNYLQKLDSIGRCSDNCQIKIVNPDTKNILGPNECGEIYVKSQFMMIGYYNKDSSKIFQEDGFIKTGDLGYYDEDECFYLLGRIKETFKYRTHNIPINNLESILMEHPAVLEAVIFGLPHHEDGYHPAACVVLKEGINATVKDIEEYYKNIVSEWHTLRGGIKVVKVLPKTPTFKIKKDALLSLFESS